MKYYRKSDIDNIISQMRVIAEKQFFAEGQNPGEESSMLKGYSIGIQGVVDRLNKLEESKTVQSVQ